MLTGGKEFDQIMNGNNRNPDDELLLVKKMLPSIWLALLGSDIGYLIFGIMGRK